MRPIKSIALLGLVSACSLLLASESLAQYTIKATNTLKLIDNVGSNPAAVLNLQSAVPTSENTGFGQASLAAGIAYNNTVNSVQLTQANIFITTDNGLPPEACGAVIHFKIDRDFDAAIHSEYGNVYDAFILVPPSTVVQGALSSLGTPVFRSTINLPNAPTLRSGQAVVFSWTYLINFSCATVGTMLSGLSVQHGAQFLYGENGSYIEPITAPLAVQILGRTNGTTLVKAVAVADVAISDVKLNCIEGAC